MIRQKLKSIIFNGVEGQAYGGNIYSFKIENNGIESPSKFMISVAYPPKKAIPIPLGTTARIETGIISFKNISSLFSCTIEQNPEYDSMHLTYHDASFILDKIYIGLNYRHGQCPDTTDEYGNKIRVRHCGDGIVLLGGEIPNMVSEKECLDCSNNIKKADTPSVTTPCDNKDVGYIVQDFIEAFPYIEDINILGKAGGDPMSYTGTLREVLSNICSDAGASFICDYATGSIKIIDASRGIEISDKDTAANPNIKKITVESSLEGTYGHYKSGFKINPTNIFSQQRENYKQITLTPENSVLSTDVILGAVAIKSPERRDAYCRSHGLYYRIGIYGSLYPPDPYGGIYQSSIKRLADCMQDSSLIDLHNQGFTYWHLSNYSDDLKNYYMNRESLALSEYGSVFRSSVIPKIEDDKTCIAEKFRSITSNQYYPDIAPDGTWRKSMGTKDLFPNEDPGLNGYYTPVIVPLVGDLLEKYLLCVQSGLIGLRDLTNAALIGWKFAYSNIAPNVGPCKHPEEELAKPLEERKDAFCKLPCEEESKDPCQILNSECSKGPGGIYQGSSFDMTTCIDGVALPVAAPYFGWVKTTQDVSKTREGELEIGQRFPPYIDANVQSIRYTLLDASGTSTNIQNIGGFSTSVFKESITKTYEIVGEFVPIIHPSLRSWNINIDGNGLITTISYQNRPPTPSKQETTIPKISSKKVSLRS